MKKILAAFFITFALAGCANLNSTVGTISDAVSSFAVTQTQIDGLRAAYNAAFLAPAANYRQLPRCSTGAKPCRDPNIVRQLQAIDKTVYRNFQAVQALIDSGNNTGLSAAWALLQESVSSAKSYAFTVGINGAAQ